MKSILHELYSGNIYPDELIVCKDPEYRQANRKIGEEKEYFKKRLSEDDRKRFDELEDLYVNASSMFDSEVFSYGFKLGAMIMLEVLTGREELTGGKND